ncbi:FGGY family carbohydrate kinase [Lacticaseibacillus suilingensis]|uniref:FGGY family carbohydrate kinase n=1 Tax=Lacticaseibacillus suilingensis TaxID=2799577 RepID=A0ABW4BH18_9LACO
MGRYLIGIDIGTYESRGMLLDSNYHVVSDCSVKHSMSNPKPGFFEHDAEDIWGAIFVRSRNPCCRRVMLLLKMLNVLALAL